MVEAIPSLTHAQRQAQHAARAVRGEAMRRAREEVKAAIRRDGRREVLMSRTGRETPTGLNDFQVVRLLKCAVKDDDNLVDAIVEKLYGTMRDFDAGRAKQTVELIVDRDTTTASKFRALLDDLLTRRPSNLAA
jgi:hypothetical protein